MSNLLQKRILQKYQEDITVLSYTKMTEEATVKCNTCSSIYSLKKAENFIRKEKTCICSKCSGNKLRLQTFQKEIDEKYPEENLEVVSFTTRKAPCSIKCLNCNNIITLKNASSFVNHNKRRVCAFCKANKRSATRKTYQKFLNWIQTQENFDFNIQNIDYTKIKSTTLITGKCKECEKYSTKTMQDYMRGRGCKYCKKNVLKTQEDFQKEVGEEYAVIKYNGMDKKGLFKHSLCGFTYSASPRGYCCPICRGSRGEKRVRYFLSKSNISFIEQKEWNIQGHLLRTDFYLPEQDKVIEYNGEQHYHPIKYFGGEDTFKRQVLYDNLKKEYFKDKLIIISYLDFEKIEEVIKTHLL